MIASLVIPPEKTPISVLQEYCQKEGQPLKWDLTKCDGEPHLPHFVYKCTVGKISGIGEGKAKKVAKQKAAEAVIKAISMDEKSFKIKGDDYQQVNPYEQPQKTNMLQVIEDLDGMNFVGALQEMASAKGLKFPEYTSIKDSGPSHYKLFHIMCTFQGMKQNGTGLKKKSAKKMAAKRMYDLISNSELYTKYKLSCSRQDQDVNDLCVHEINLDEEKDSFRDPLIIRLENLGKSLDFKVNYLTSLRKTVTGLSQCLVHLSLTPEVIVHGCGEVVEVAKINCAKNALHFIKTHKIS